MTRPRSDIDNFMARPIRVGDGEPHPVRRWCKRCELEPARGEFEDAGGRGFCSRRCMDKFHQQEEEVMALVLESSITENLVLDTQSHRYLLNGVPLPGVTTILKAAGLIEDIWFTDEARTRGQAVHLATRYIDEDDSLDWDTVKPEYAPRVRAYVDFKARMGFEPTLIEEPLASVRYGFAGTLDRAGMANNLHTLFDLKTGPYQRWQDLQLAAYEILAEENGQPPIQERFIVHLREDGTPAIHAPKTNPRQARELFLAALNLFHWRKR